MFVIFRDVFFFFFREQDSPHVLETLDPAKVYVIGGLVDRSVQKHTTLEHAAALGLARQTARLPVYEKFLPSRRFKGHCCFTLEQVVRCLCAYRDAGGTPDCWEAALRGVVPTRKLLPPPEDEQQEQGGGNEMK